MATLSWQIINNPDKLWVKIMKFKYNVGSYGTPNMVEGSNVSNVWKAVSNNWPLVGKIFFG